MQEVKIVKKIVIHPITRIEGHLKVEAIVENGIVKDANISGTMFRGIEIMLLGRDPRDAIVITQRICGVCPEPHACASVKAVEQFVGLSDSITPNGILLRNLILATRTIADHILHFYILSGPDYVDPARVANYDGDDKDLSVLKSFLEQGYSKPFLPRDNIDYKLDDKTNREVVSHYLKALDIYRKAQEAATIFGGKWPHDAAIVAGGVSQKVTADLTTQFMWRMKEIADFVKNIYIPDVIEVAKAYSEYLTLGKGCANLLAYDGYLVEGKPLLNGGLITDIDKYSEIDIKNITEDVTSSWYDGDPVYPIEEKTNPSAKKGQAYSWIKSPRYKGEVFEVGPLASILATYLTNSNARVTELVDSSLAQIGGNIFNMYSIIGRHLARALEAEILVEEAVNWIESLKPGEPTTTEYNSPKDADGEGIGLVAAPRGALGHWLKVEKGRISNYQVITPTAWNASPKDKDGQPGPYEQAIIGLKVSESQAPVEILRAIRSFDPCTACAVHLSTPKGDLLGKYKVV